MSTSSMMVGRGERLFLYGAWAVIAAVAALGVVRHLQPPRRDVAPSPEEETGPLTQAFPTVREAMPEPTFPISVRGRVVDLPALPVDPGILRWTRLQIFAGERACGAAVAPAADGSFRVDGSAPRRPRQLRISIDLHYHSFDRRIWRDLALPDGHHELGDLFLPRADDQGRLTGQVVDTEGHEIAAYALEFGADEETPTPDLGLARLGGLLDHAANAPTLYRDGPRFTILHIPTGVYRLQARATNHLLPPVRVIVRTGETRAMLKETPTRRRLKGSVRDAQNGLPLGSVEITAGTTDWAGAATRDPLRVLGRTSGGLYDLPLPEQLPAGGMTLTFSKQGYRAAELRLAEGSFGGEWVARRDLDLGRD